MILGNYKREKVNFVTQTHVYSKQRRNSTNIAKHHTRKPDHHHSLVEGVSDNHLRRVHMDNAL